MWVSFSIIRDEGPELAPYCKQCVLLGKAPGPVKLEAPGEAVRQALKEYGLSEADVARTALKAKRLFERGKEGGAP